LFDLYQCHWVHGSDGKLYIANAPSVQAPIRFGMRCPPLGSERRLDPREAALIYQAALHSGMQVMTFLHSQAGLDYVRQLMSPESFTEVS